MRSDGDSLRQMAQHGNERQPGAQELKWLFQQKVIVAANDRHEAGVAALRFDQEAAGRAGRQARQQAEVPDPLLPRRAPGHDQRRHHQGNAQQRDISNPTDNELMLDKVLIARHKQEDQANTQKIEALPMAPLPGQPGCRDCNCAGQRPLRRGERGLDIPFLVQAPKPRFKTGRRLDQERAADRQYLRQQHQARQLTDSS